MSLKRVLVSTLISFTVVSLGLLIGYVLDPRPLSSYEDIALFAFLVKQWYMIPCFGFLLCGFIGEIVLMFLGKVDGDGMYW